MDQGISGGTAHSPANGRPVVEMYGYRMNLAEYITRSLVVLRDHFGPFFGFAVLAVLAQMLLEPAVLIGPALLDVFFAGAILVTLKILKRRDFVFSEFFDGFKDFLNIFLLSIVSTVIILVGLMVFIVPGIYFAVAYTLAIPFVLDRKMSFWEAMESSRKTVQKRFFTFLALYIILFLLALVVFMPGLMVIGGGIGALITEDATIFALLSMLPAGLLMLAVPLLFMLPFSLVLKGVIYDDIARQCDPDYTMGETVEAPIGSGSVV